MMRGWGKGSKKGSGFKDLRKKHESGTRDGMGFRPLLVVRICYDGECPRAHSYCEMLAGCSMAQGFFLILTSGECEIQICPSHDFGSPL